MLDLSKLQHISDIAIDSRKVSNNSLFFCLAPNKEITQQYVDHAISNGAHDIVYQFEVSQVNGINYYQVDNVFDSYVAFCHSYFNNVSEKLRLVGVTGTNGKTTITSLIKSIGSHFINSGQIGTNGLAYNQIEKDTSLTTPFLHDTLAYLTEMKKHKVQLCAMETSSEALHQQRTKCLDFDVAIFSNLSHDHLNYHKTFENYFLAKKILFDELKGNAVAIVNQDDPYTPQLIKDSKAKVMTYGINEKADYFAQNIVLKPTSTTFELVVNNVIYPVETNLVALFNVSNLLSVIACLHQLGFNLEEVLPLLKDVKSIDGRLNHIDVNGRHVLVDYAHTPDGFEKIYEYANTIKKEGRIISVFGSAGKRDKDKRPVLGEIASQYSDFIILTEEDNRDEEVIDIAHEIKRGIKNTETLIIEDRYLAIKKSIEISKVNDLILILGKGAETFLDRGTKRENWISDVEAVYEIKKQTDD